MIASYRSSPQSNELTSKEYEGLVPLYDRSPKTDWYYALGLNGEAGEVAEIVKKAHRDGHEVSPQKVADELGDVLWYVTRLAQKYGYTLGRIMDLNIKKLSARAAAGEITG